MVAMNPNNSRLCHNVGTLRSRTGLTRQASEDFLCGRGVSGGANQHICRRFGLESKGPAKFASRTEVEGLGGRLPAGSGKPNRPNHVPPPMGESLGDGKDIKPIGPKDKKPGGAPGKRPTDLFGHRKPPREANEFPDRRASK